MGRLSTAFFVAIVATVVVALGSGCRTPVYQRPIEDCDTMTAEELRQPIYRTPVRRISFHEAPYVRRKVTSVVVAVGVNEEGYVTNPRVVWANPRSGSYKGVIESVSQWRFCPALSTMLRGKPIKIPLEFKVREIRGPSRYGQ